MQSQSTGAIQELDRQPNADFKRIYNTIITSKWENDHPEECYSKNGNPKVPTTSRQCLMVAETLQQLQQSSNSYSKLFYECGHALPLDGSKDDKYLHHLIEKLENNKILDELKALQRLKSNPFNQTISELLEKQQPPGRKCTDFGKSCLSYNKLETTMVKHLLTQTEEQTNVNITKETLEIFRRISDEVVAIVKKNLKVKSNEELKNLSYEIIYNEIISVDLSLLPSYTSILMDKKDENDDEIDDEIDDLQYKSKTLVVCKLFI